MNDETGFLAAALKELLTSTAVILAAWGAPCAATRPIPARPSATAWPSASPR